MTATDRGQLKQREAPGGAPGDRAADDLPGDRAPEDRAPGGETADRDIACGGTPGGDAPGLPLAAQIEAILFVADRPVAVGELAKLLQAPPDAVEDALAHLDARSAGGGVALQRHGDRLQLVSHPQAADVVQRFLGLEMSARLSAAALETLAVIAYRQPVTRAEIEAIRGVNPDHALANLVARGLVEETGRLSTVGRPIQYGTTFEFLRAFGLRSLADLPASGELGRPEPERGR